MQTNPTPTPAASAAMRDVLEDHFGPLVESLSWMAHLVGEELEDAVQDGAAIIDRHMAPVYQRVRELEAENARLRNELACLEGRG